MRLVVPLLTYGESSLSAAVRTLALKSSLERVIVQPQQLASGIDLFLAAQGERRKSQR
jgi:hypothetical protein